MSVRAESVDARPARSEARRDGALLLTALLFPAGYATAGAFLLLLASAALALHQPRALWGRTLLDLPLALFFLSLVGSAVRSPFPAMAAGSTLLLALLVALAYGAVTATVTRSPRVLSLLLVVLGAGTAGAAIWGTAVYLITGQQAHTVAMGYNPTGTTLAAGLPLLVGMMAWGPARLRLAAGVAAALTLVGLAFTFARGAWIGGLAGLLLLLATRPRESWRPVLVLLLLALVVGAVGLATPSAQMTDRARTFFTPSSGRDRVAMWRASLAMFRDHPLLGTGLNTFGLVYPRYRLPEDPAPGQPFAHNLFLNVAVEGGALGLATFTGVLVTAAGLGVRWLRRSDGAAAVRAASVLAAAAALIVHQQLDGTALSFHVGFGVWLLLGMMAAGGTTRPAKAPAASRSGGPRPPD